MYENEFGQPRRRLMEKLFRDVRADSVQHERHRKWVEERAQGARNRIDAGRWNPEIDWQSLATESSSFGRYSVGLGDLVSAKAALENALAIWKIRGHCLAHIQVKAIPELEAELAQL